ncbi:MAG: helix-turn-helix transcriptional regulator, partial [Jatrophihabitantaceae bacterium]
LARALLFQGLLAQAAAVGEQAAEAALHHDLDLLRVVLAATLGYLAALRGNGMQLLQAIELITTLAPRQAPSYYRTGAMVLASFALAAAGQAEAASGMLLDGGGGPDLPGLQRVDQAYGYELLTAAALALGQLAQAQAWAARATALRGLPAGGMAAAAVRRTTARLAAARGDAVTSAVLATQAAAFAADNAGHLDAARARLLAGTALLQSTSASEPARQHLSAAAEQARLLGATSLHLLARRDLRSIGLRLAGGGEPPMSRRERQIADLVMAGLSNAQIARVLSISPRTVQGHVARVLIALDLPSRSAIPRAMLPTMMPPDTELLTARQRDVADLIHRGYTNDGIALALGVSVKTVEKHLGAIYQRLGVRSRTALAARWAG